MRLAHKNEHMNELLASKCSLSLILIHLGIFTIYNAYYIVSGLPYGSGSELCYLGEGAREVDAFAKMAAIIPVMCFSFVSIFVDVLIIRKLQNHVLSEEEDVGGIGNSRRRRRNRHQQITYNIPVQATLFSALTIVPYAAISVKTTISMPVLHIHLIPSHQVLLALSSLNKKTSILVVMYISAILNAIRCPITVRVTYAAKVKKDNQTREKRQERERQLALAERNKRRGIKAVGEKEEELQWSKV